MEIFFHTSHLDIKQLTFLIQTPFEYLFTHSIIYVYYIISFILNIFTIIYNQCHYYINRIFIYDLKITICKYFYFYFKLHSLLKFNHNQGGAKSLASKFIKFFKKKLCFGFNVFNRYSYNNYRYLYNLLIF